MGTVPAHLGHSWHGAFSALLLKSPSPKAGESPKVGQPLFIIHNKEHLTKVHKN